MTTIKQKSGRKPMVLIGNSFPVRVARAMRAEMATRNWTPDHVCKKLGFESSVFYRLYNGRSAAATGRYLDKLAALFGMTATLLLQNGVSDASVKPQKKRSSTDRA